MVGLSRPRGACLFLRSFLWLFAAKKKKHHINLDSLPPKLSKRSPCKATRQNPTVAAANMSTGTVFCFFSSASAADFFLPRGAAAAFVPSKRMFTGTHAVKAIKYGGKKDRGRDRRRGTHICNPYFKHPRSVYLSRRLCVFLLLCLVLLRNGIIDVNSNWHKDDAKPTLKTRWLYTPRHSLSF